MGIFDRTSTAPPAGPDAETLAKLERVRRPCWIPQTEPGEGPPAGSRFAGRAMLSPGETWPVCPSCRKPMQLFVQLNSAELPSELGTPWGEGLLQLFYCVGADPNCEADQGSWAAFSPCTLLRVLPLGGVLPGRQPVRDPFPATHVVGWTRSDDYPNEEERGYLGAVLRDDEGKTDDAAEEAMGAVYPLSGAKLGGWPGWVQGVEYPSCPACGATMRHLFQIDSDDPLPYMFGDSGCAHITQCPNHPQVLAFAWACC